MENFEVEICRIHKSSPYNCVLFFNEIKAKNAMGALKSVMKDVAKTYGKHFIAHVYNLKTGAGHEFEISKPKAITA